MCSDAYSLQRDGPCNDVDDEGFLYAGVADCMGASSRPCHGSTRQTTTGGCSADAAGVSSDHEGGHQPEPWAASKHESWFDKSLLRRQGHSGRGRGRPPVRRGVSSAYGGADPGLWGGRRQQASAGDPGNWDTWDHGSLPSAGPSRQQEGQPVTSRKTANRHGTAGAGASAWRGGNGSIDNRQHGLLELGMTQSFRLRAGGQANGHHGPRASSRGTPGLAGGQADLKSALTALAAGAGLMDKRETTQVSGGAGGSPLAGTAGGTAPPMEGFALPSSAYLPTAEFLSEPPQDMFVMMVADISDPAVSITNPRCIKFGNGQHIAAGSQGVVVQAEVAGQVEVDINHLAAAVAAMAAHGSSSSSDLLALPDHQTDQHSEEGTVSQRVAIKFACLPGRGSPSSAMSAEHAAQQLVNEYAATLAALHPGVSPAFGIGYIPQPTIDGAAFRTSPCLILELMPGSLFEYWRACHRARLGHGFTMHEAAMLVRPVMKTLADLHARGIIHRDIKTENILVSAQPGLSADKTKHFTSCKYDELTMKICDFGGAHILDRAPVTNIGTYGYQAPEVGGGDAYDATVDCYACAQMYAGLREGKQPHEGSSDFMRKNAHPKEFDWYKRAVADPKERSTMQKLLEDLDDLTRPAGGSSPVSLAGATR